MLLKKNNKCAYRTGEKALMFLKRLSLSLSVIIFVVIVILGIKFSGDLFPLKNIVITGNKNVGEDEIKSAISSAVDKGILRLSSKEINRRLETLPWIKKIYLRKQFPDTLMIRLEEAVPKALLNLNNGLFLIDGEGRILEEIRSQKTPFLPVITGINPKSNSADIIEALKLIEALSQKGILSNMESIEITSGPYGLSMNMDGETFRIGYKRYHEKLQRWKELEGELRRKGMAIEYIDLRFIDKVIVKPLKEGSRVPNKSTNPAIFWKKNQNR